MASNVNLHNSKAVPKDEYYTLYEDIDKELSQYSQHLEGKTILCPCDDADSNFFLWFANNFERLNLKEVIATSFKYSRITGSQQYLNKPAITLRMSASRCEVVEQWGDGDFRSEETWDLIAEADVIATNPPFSLFDPMLRMLFKRDKKFMLVGNKNAIAYAAVFPYFLHKHLRLGLTTPKAFRSAYSGKSESVAAVWYSNFMDLPWPEPVPLVKTYRPDLYPEYDNYPAISVGRTADIPKDYDGPMGVPVSYMSRHNPSQFNLLGSVGDARLENQLLYSRLIVQARKL